MNDVIDLHQNAVDELRGQLAQVESMTVGKSQDLEDAMEECQSKVGGGGGERGKEKRGGRGRGVRGGEEGGGWERGKRKEEGEGGGDRGCMGH